MRRFRMWGLVSSLTVAVTAAAGTNALIADVSDRVVAAFPLDVVTMVFDFIVMYNRFSIPPG